MSLKVKTFFKNPILFFLIMVTFLKPEGLLAIAPESLARFFAVWDKLVGLPVALLCILALLQDRHPLCGDLVLYYGYRMLATVLTTWLATGLITGGGAFHQLWMLSAVWFLALSLKYNFHKTIDRLAALLAILVLANLATIMLFPNGMYHDVNVNNWLLGYNNGHIVTYMPALFFSYQYWYYRKKRLLPLLTWGAVYLSVFLTHSTTTKIGLLILLVLALVILIPGFRKYFFNWKTVAFIVAVVFFGIVISRGNGFFRTHVVSFLNKDSSFASRRTLWNRAIQSFRLHPWLGTGDATKTNVSLFKLVQDHAFAHNEILDVLVRTGIIGLLLYLNCIFRSIYTLKGKKDRHSKMWLSFMAAYWVAMMFESYSNYSFYYLYFVMLLFPQYSLFAETGKIQTFFKRNEPWIIKL